MIDDLHSLAKQLDGSAPDLKIARIMQEEREAIKEALETVGEYVISDDDGRIYVIQALKPPKMVNDEWLEFMEAFGL